MIYTFNLFVKYVLIKMYRCKMLFKKIHFWLNNSMLNNLIDLNIKEILVNPYIFEKSPSDDRICTGNEVFNNPLKTLDSSPL